MSLFRSCRHQTRPSPQLKEAYLSPSRLRPLPLVTLTCRTTGVLHLLQASCCMFLFAGSFSSQNLWKCVNYEPFDDGFFFSCWLQVWNLLTGFNSSDRKWSEEERPGFQRKVCVCEISLENKHGFLAAPCVVFVGTLTWVFNIVKSCTYYNVHI